MADIYKPAINYIDTGVQPSGQSVGGQGSEVDEYINSLPQEEREAAIKRLTAPPSAKEIAESALASGRPPSLDEFRAIREYNKTKEVPIIEAIGNGFSGVMTDLGNAMGSAWNDPVNTLKTAPANVIEGFAQGTRNFYGMLAQSADPSSKLFRLKSVIGGSDSDAEQYRQYMDAWNFNKHSEDLVSGKTTVIMDKDVIDPHIVQAMSYVLDPTLFIPFGEVAGGIKAIGMGEKLTALAARAEAIKAGVIGGTLKWGVGAPIEFMGGAVRNTIDYGIEKAGAAFEGATGMTAREFQQTARASGIGFSASGIAGHSIPFATGVSDAYIIGSTARGFGEAISAIGDTITNAKYGRGINSFAKEALEQTEKQGIQLSGHAKGLLKALDTIDPLFSYANDITKGAAHGALIGGGLGYLSGGEEGMAHGIGAGIGLGAVGAGAGRVFADATGATQVARRAVQAKMVIEGHKERGNTTKAMSFEAMQKATEAAGGDVDFVNGVIAGIDKVAPNFEFHALTPEQFRTKAIEKGYDPRTGKFREFSNSGFETFGDNRASRGKTQAFLRLIGSDYVGNKDALIELSKDTKFKNSKLARIKESFNRLSQFEKDFVLEELGRQKEAVDGGQIKPHELRGHYESLAWAESWTDQITNKYNSDSAGAMTDIKDMIAQETVKGKLTKKGEVLVDKLRAEGFLDREGKPLRERNLHNADLKLQDFARSKGAVVSREADGKTHMYINLNSFGRETFPHELFHTIFRESALKHQFLDGWVKRLLGVRDEQGNLVKKGEVSMGEVRKFFERYIRATSRNEDGTVNLQAVKDKLDPLDAAIKEYETLGDTKKLSDRTQATLLEHYAEEFGAYYFSHWLMGKNRNTLFYGGELRGIAGLMDSVKDSFLDFWQSKISKQDPTFDFSKGLNEGFNRNSGLGRVKAMDYWMRDMIRAEANSNRGAFRVESMSPENRREFLNSNGMRNITPNDGTRVLTEAQAKAQNKKAGIEAYKILDGLDPKLRTSKTVLDENGKPVITGRLSVDELNELVKAGIVPRAWADKLNQGYAMLDGQIPNVVSFGYLGATAQTTHASYPRLTGKDVPFKNRKAIVFDIETKIGSDGRFYTLFHTLDKAVIEVRSNNQWRNADVQAMWGGDRAAFEADFFRYLSNASKAGTDNTKLDTAILLDKGDGLGAQRRNVMHDVAGIAQLKGDSYRNEPIARIPEGILHAVTSFNVDRMTTMRVENERFDYNDNNANRFIRENWQPDDMKQEKTPSGVLMTHASGFKFSNINGKTSAYANDGSKIGTYGTIKEATSSAKNFYNKVQENTKKTAEAFRQHEQEKAKNLQPLDEGFYEEAFRIGDMFKTKRMQEIVGNSKLVRQTFDEFLGQKVEEINSGKNEKEKGAILQQLFSSEFKELIDLEAELKKTYDEFGLEASQLQEQETEITKKIIELSQERKRLQQFSDPEARADVGILDMYGRIYHRKQEVNKRLSEIANKMHNEGITDLNSHYYITKRFLERFNETGELSKEAIKFVLTPRLIKEYEANFETGKAVTFLANHGTPNHELMVSKTFDMGFLGRNTGSMSAFNATFFAGSKETSVNYVGNPIEMSWVRNFIDARSFYVKNLPIDVRVKIERLLQSDTSKGVVQKTSQLQKTLHEVFPDDFKLSDTGRLNKDGEPVYNPYPKTNQGEHIYNLVDRILEGANDEGWAIGGYEMYWNQAGRKPYLLRNIVKMDNPLVHEYAKADYRDETFASVIKRAKEAGHDGVIFKNTKDGGGLDTIFASFAKNEDNKIFTLETSEDTRFAPRGTDEAGNKIKNGSEIEGRNYQPTEAPLVDSVEMAEARRLGDLFKTKQMREFVGDRKVVPQTADEGYIDFIKKWDSSEPISKETALMMLDEMSKNMFGGLDRQTNRLRLNELYEKAIVAFDKDNPKMKGLYKELPERRLKEYLPINEYIEAKRLEESLAKPAQQKQIHSEFTIKTAKEFAQKIREARRWIEKALPSYNDFAGYIKDNIPLREYYQHAVFSKQFRTGEPVVAVGVHGTNTSEGYLKTGRYSAGNKKLEAGEVAGAYFAASDNTALSEEYQGYDRGSNPPNIAKSAIRFDNPLVVDGQQTPMMKRTEKILGEAIEKGHDGVIYINQTDGGGLDVSFIVPAEKVNQHQRLIGSTREKAMAGDAYEPLPRGEGLTNKTANLQPVEGEQGGRTYTDEQLADEFIGKYANENKHITKGLSIEYWSPDYDPYSGVDGDLDTSKFILKIEKSGDLVGEISAEFERSSTFFNGEKDVEGLILRDISIHLEEKHRGKGYQHLFYSELLERARAQGAIGFTQNVENKLGLPLKSINKIVGKDGSKIWTLRDWSPIEPTQENFDRLMSRAPKMKDYRGNHAEYVQNNGKLDPKAWYQPSESWEKTRELGMKSTWDSLPEASRKLFELNIKKFGLTNSPYEAGYILPDARMLDFSGRSQSSGFKRVKDKYIPTTKFDDFRDYRGLDHREAVMLPEEEKKMKEEYGWEEDKIGKMQQAGAIRIDHSNYGKDDGRTYLDIGSVPTNKQYEAILDIIKNSVINKEKHTLGVDIRVNGKAINHPLHDMSVENPERVILALKREVNKAFKQESNKPKFQPTEGEQGGRTYTDKQMSSEFIGRYADENAKVTKGLKPKFSIFGSGDQGNIELMKGQDSIGYINFSFSKATGDALIEYTNVARGQQGKGYGNLLYSELVERLRSMGMKEVQGMIIDERGRPQKIRERIIDRENARIGGDRTQIDYVEKDTDSDATHTGVTSYIYNKAWYQPDEKIGTQSSNVKLLLEGMASGRILRTSSYKGLGLEDSLLIAHTPDTAKIGQVTAGDKALADLQGGIFYAIANGKKIWASNFAGEGETNILVKFANRALKKNEGNKTYIMLVKADNSKIFASVDGARGVSSIFKHLNDSGVMSDLKYVKALKDSAKKHLNLTGLDGLGKDELFSKIDDAILNSEANKISFERRAKFSRSIATLLKDSGAFDSERSKKALAESFNSGFERGFSKKEMERVFGNLMAEDIIKDVPVGHVYGAIEIVSPLTETKESNHRGYNASIVQESGEPARLIMFDKTAHVTEVLNKKSGERILKKDPTRHLKDSEGNYVHETDETGELVLTKRGKPKRIVEYKGEGSYISYTGGNIPYQEVRGKKKMPFQPSEYTEFKSEQSPTGRILRNAKGYVIMLANNKFRVYNPAKAIIGVYGSEEEAKKRIYKEIPKQ